MAEGYCMKCRRKVEMAEAHEEVLKNNRRALVGKCSTCGTKVVKMLPKAT
jgi:DNA-directed RNA polymerase subunit RPC12/RpoP